MFLARLEGVNLERLAREKVHSFVPKGSIQYYTRNFTRFMSKLLRIQDDELLDPFSRGCNEPIRLELERANNDYKGGGRTLDLMEAIRSA